MAAIVLLASCGGEGGDVDGGADGPGIDAPIGGPDGSPSIDAPLAAPDGRGVDAPVPACSETALTASCFYAGYGTMCPVPCSFAETCSFNVFIGWTGNYCCLGTEQWVDCRCVDGFARCARFPGSTDRVTPTTVCEFCDPPDAGG